MKSTTTLVLRNFSPLQPLLIIVALAAAAIAAHLLRPAQTVATRIGAIHLQTQIPTAFGQWREAHDIVPVLPDPEIQKNVAKIYSQTVARTYVDKRGNAVMLTAAYGGDQSGELTQVHRPEICYRAQGFNVQPLRDDQLQFGAASIPLRRLLTARGSRREPVSYWVTVGNQPVLPGINRKFEQLRLGLSGWVADGVLIRVSSIDTDSDRAFAVQDQFLHELAATMVPAVRRRYFGF